MDYKKFCAQVSAAAAVGTVCFSLATSAVAAGCPDGWTWIDHGNDARVGDYVGKSGANLCVQYVDAETGDPVEADLWRDADPGPKKGLGHRQGHRCLKTKGLRYSVFVRNTRNNGRPICAISFGDKVKTISVWKSKY